MLQSVSKGTRMGRPRKVAPKPDVKKQSPLTETNSENQQPPMQRKRGRPAGHSKKENDQQSKKPKLTKEAKEEIRVEPLSRTAGMVLTFGEGDVGQLGLGEPMGDRTKPALVPGMDNVIAIVAGGMHTVCLKQNGEVHTWGCNDEGALGREGMEAKPGLVNLPGKAARISAGDSHTAAVLEDGRVFAWGTFRDMNGSMGLDLRGPHRLPVQLLAGVPVVSITSGCDHLVMLSDKGNVYTCGCAEQGQLSRVSEQFSQKNSRRGPSTLLTPCTVKFRRRSTAITDVWSGQYTTIMKEKSSGRIYVSGLNNYSQLGLPDLQGRYQPEIPESFRGREWRQIIGGQHHTVALDSEGKVYTVGRGDYGRLGLGNGTSDALVPTLVPTLSAKKCVQVGCGTAVSFAVTEDGELYGWGMGSSKQLGNKEEEDLHVPTRIEGKNIEGHKVIAVAGGGQHTVILAVPSPH